MLKQENLDNKEARCSKNIVLLSLKVQTSGFRGIHLWSYRLQPNEQSIEYGLYSSCVTFSYQVL